MIEFGTERLLLTLCPLFSAAQGMVALQPTWQGVTFVKFPVMGQTCFHREASASDG